MKITHVFFDLDNTLFDFTAASNEALKSFAEVLNVPYDNSFLDVYHEHNQTAWHLFERGVIDSMTLRRSRFENTAEHYGIKLDGLMMNRKYLRLLVENKRFMNGAEEILDYLHPNYSLSAITNGLKEVQRPRLMAAEIDHLFDSIVVSDEIGLAKPDSRYFQFAWENVDCPPKEQVIVIGDNPHSDILGGREFGFNTCLFDPSQKYDQIESDYQISSLHELKQIL